MLSSGQMTTAASCFHFLVPFKCCFFAETTEKAEFRHADDFDALPCLPLPFFCRSPPSLPPSLPPSFTSGCHDLPLARYGIVRLPLLPRPRCPLRALRPLGGGWRLAADCCRLFYCAPNDARKCCRCPSARPPLCPPAVPPLLRLRILSGRGRRRSVLVRLSS